jgi:hypothetical protein
VTAARTGPELDELSKEFGEEWVVWRPGRYAADHCRFDVSLVSDTVAGLADRLRCFIGMTKGLP